MFQQVPTPITSFSLYTQQCICHTACEQDQEETTLNLLASFQHSCIHCCLYSEKPLTMDRGTDRNLLSFIAKTNLRN